MNNVSMPALMKKSLYEQQVNNTIYSGGHSSNHDPGLRSRLRAFVERYDQELFNSTIALYNKVLDCGISSERQYIAL